MLAYIAGFFDGEGSIGVYKATRQGRDRFCLRTQLTQNSSLNSEYLFKRLTARYGGNASLQGKKRNWQLNGDKAMAFLQDIAPFLILKRSQAELAIAWQKQRPPLERNTRGHVVFRQEPDIEFDRKVCKLMKELKVDSLDTVMANQADLVEVVAILKQVLCAKG